MAKQTLKQEMIQQIANSQVQQVMQERQAAQLQANFAAWQKEQDDIAQLQASFAAWQKENAQPVQQPVQEIAPVKAQQTIPSLGSYKDEAKDRALARRQRLSQLTKSNKENQKQREDYQRQQQEEAILASRDAMKGEKKWNESVDNTLAMLNSNDFKNMAKKGKAQSIIEQNKANANNATQTDVDRWLSPGIKLTQEEKDAARAYAAAELAKIPTNASTHQPMVDTDEEKQHYRDMVEIMNKTNPISSTMSGYAELPFNLVDMVGDVGRSIGNQISGLGAAITDKLGITEGATQRNNERIAAANEAADLKEANQRQSFANAQTQYPGAYTGGKIAGQVTAYALTNPIFDGIAEGAGVTNQLAKFFINQGAQNAQDLALDTAPLVKQLMSDGSLSEEDKREVFNNILMNAGGNLALGGLDVWAKNKAARKAARQASDEAFRQNVREGADRLARLAGTEDVDNIVRNAARQAEEATQNIENIAKQMPESYNATDVYGDADNYFVRKNPGGKNTEQIMAERDALIRQIDDYENGRLPQTEYIHLGQTPEYMRAYGNINNPLVMKQSTINKTAYPEGYFNGKHNLGFEALAEIPEQLNDPAAVMDSLTQNNSGVALTNLLKNDRPVIAPIHMDKPSPMGPINELASIHDRDLDNIGQMLERTNKPYINKEKVRDVLSGNGLQLSELKATADPLLNHKVTDAIPEVNKNSVNNVGSPKLLTDDMESQLAYDFENLGDSYYGNREVIRQSLENKDFSIPNATINEVPGKNGKTKYEIVDLDTNRTIKSFATRKAAEKAQADYIAGDVLKEKAIKAFEDIDGAIYRYEKAAYNSADVEEVNTAKKAVEAARKRYERAMKELDPSYYDAVSSKDFGDRIARPYYTRNPAAENPVDENLVNGMVNEWVDRDINNPNRFARDAEPDSTNVFRGVNNVPGAEPLQTFADGTPKNDWKISKARTNTFENQGWGDNLPEKDFAYRVQSTADTHEIKAERYKNSENIAADLLNKDYDTFDAADVKASMETIQELMDNGDFGTAKRLAERLAHEGREGGRTIQAFAEYNKNSISGALRDASNAQEDFVLEPWRSKNKKAREGNSRIAKALADMGHKPNSKIKPELTHDQIKNGVIAELNREVGSVEQYFNDNDIEFLTRLAEDKSVPTWQITSEIEHKLNTGDWYTIDESVDMPKPTNRRLQNALNSLVTETVRAESEAPSLKQIAEEVRNTLGKESADFEGLFTDDDMDYLANLIHEGATKDELADALDMKLATGSFGISDETLQEVNNIFKQISNYDPNSKQFVEGQAEAYRLLANEILPNATLKEKFEAWRYIAMLGNPKTMLRNYIGNQTFNVVTGISNNIAAIAEAGIDRATKALGGEGIQRTKAILNPVTDSGLIKAAAEDADASRYRQIIGSKYEKMSKDTLRRSKSVFNSKLAQLYEKVTDAGISDYSAVKKKYSTSLAGYMKANGMSTDIFKAEEELRNLRNLSETRLLSDAEKARVATLSNQVQELEKARDYALKQAEYATFHEDNKIADVLSKWSRTSKEEGTGIGHVLIEGVVPFKKTPANVLRSGVEYSPLGVIDSIKKTGKLIYENTGARKGNLADVYKNKAGKDVARTLASDVIDSWSKTLTGTGLTALGYYLYNKGILHSSNPDTKYQDELEGHQNYAIEINGKSYTIDWAAPSVMPLMMGAEIAKLWDSTGKGDEDFYNNIDGYVEAANRIADPLIETSMLQGVRDTLETAATYAQNNEAMNILPLLGYNVATGYATQGIPTLGGQIARTIDPTRRSSYTDKEGVAGVLDRQVKKQMNKIPGVSMLNQPYVDTYGREQQNGPFNNPLARLGYQMFSPGYLTNINETDADRVSREAFEVGNVANTLPKWQSKFKDAEGNRVSPEDYTTASKAYGQANYEIRDALANDDWFNSLEDSQKEEIVKGINTIAEHVGNAAIDPEYSKDSKPYNAYKDGGVKGLLDYYKGETAKNTAKDLLGDSGVTTNSNAGKAVTEAVKNGNMAQAEKLAEQAKAEKAEKVKTEETKEDLSSYGLTSISPAKTYEKAQTIIPGLTTEKFATTYKKIDADGNQGIKQDEVIAYLNSQKITSESEAKKIWSAYGNSTWKSIPKLENGKWVKKKK